MTINFAFVFDTYLIHDCYGSKDNVNRGSERIPRLNKVRICPGSKEIIRGLDARLTERETSTLIHRIRNAMLPMARMGSHF